MSGEYVSGVLKMAINKFYDRWDGWILALLFLGSFVLYVVVSDLLLRFVETMSGTDFMFGCFCVGMLIIGYLYLKGLCWEENK